MTTDKYSYCPNCRCKTVYWKGRPNGEDGYTCRRSECDFEFYTLGNSQIDRTNEERWEEAQLPARFHCAREGSCDVTPRCTKQCDACKGGA